MCGIVGAVALNKQSIDVRHAKPMADIIRHRGPDDAGYLFIHSGCRHERSVSFHLSLTDNEFRNQSRLLPSIDDRQAKQELSSHDWDIFFGHRRLSIIDTSFNGHQPMSDLSKKIWVVFNGEIYNFREIRDELIARGYGFKTKSDTEVLLYAYAEWGIDSIKKFNGMFAFALYDDNKKSLFLARDRYGIKPLYYTITDSGTLIFASEPKAILKYPEYSQALDLKAVYEYFTFQNILTDRTFHDGIKLLPPGHFVQVRLQSENPAFIPQKYWDFNFEEPEDVKDEIEYTEELERLFQQAVKRQLVSDVEIGSYLSGGMDSGSITAVAASQIENLKSFTIGFDLNNASGLELAFDERARSEQLSYLNRTEHYEMVLKSGDMERCMPKFAWHLGTPRVGQSYPNYYASKLASKFVKVVLSGAGGDELFGGYPWRYYRAVNNSSIENYINKYYAFWQRLASEDELKQMFSPVWEKVKGVNTRDIFRDVFRGHHENISSPENYVNHSLYFEAKTFLHGLLVVEDKLSMAHSLETRVPFLDNDLVDFAMKVPVNMKLGNLKEVSRISENEIAKEKKYFQKNKDGKLILRKALSKYLPVEFTSGVKQGFSSPDNSWFKGDSIEFVKQALSEESSIYNVLNYSATQKVLDQHLSGESNRRLLVWGMLNFAQWHKLYQIDYKVNVSAFA